MTSSAGTMDFDDRDPHSINTHLQFSFEEVIGEPDGYRSPAFVWRMSHKIFDCSKSCCYIFLAILCAPITACCLGCNFACHSFQQIWCTNPAIRFCKITYRSFKIFVTIFVEACLVPIAEGCGKCCSAIKVKRQTLMDDVPEKIELLPI